VTVSPDDPAISVQTVEFPSADGAMVFGYMAGPAAPGTYHGVVVIHENRGLVPHIQDIVRRYAKSGFVAVAPDLVSREGGTDNLDPAQVPGALGNADPSRLADDAIAAGSFLRAQDGVQPDAHGITGFCFGGGVAWLTATRDDALGAAVPYYGPPPPLDAATHIKAASLGLYGELDQRITGSIPNMEAALTTAGVPHQFVVYPGANHAFFNDTAASYNAEAAADAWPRTLAWFREYLPTTG
jgi:carboxymethylenebutenolidase